MAKFKEVKMFSKDGRFIEETIYYIKKDSKKVATILREIEIEEKDLIKIDKNLWVKGD